MSIRKKLLIVVFVLGLSYFLFSSKELFIAATVNGYPVSRISVIRDLEKQGGSQVLDNLINEMLITQEAKKAGVVVTETEIDARIDELKDQMSAQGQDIDTLLSSQGVSQEEFRKNIRIQVFVEKVLGDKVTVTDEQIASFVETNKAFLPADLSEDELKDLARQELTQQELANQYSTWIAEVKQNSDIKYFVEY